MPFEYSWAGILRRVCRTIIVFIGIAFSMQIYANADKSSKFIKYSFSYKTSHEKNSFLNISLSFRGDTSGETKIELPSQIAGISDLYKNIKNLRVTNASLEKTRDPKIFLLHHAPNNIIFITYQVKQGWHGSVTDPQQSLVPIFQKSYFQFPGEGVFIYPESYKNQKSLPVTFEWDVPAKWIISNSYGAHITSQSVTTDLGNILRGLYVGGDFRLYDTSDNKGLIWIAMQGKWNFSDEEFNHLMVKIISNGRSFWNDDSPHYLASLLQIGSSCKTGGGSGHTNAFSAFFNMDCTLMNNNILHILSHETFHNWNGSELFDVSDKKREVYFYWFTEGFTDYYASLLNFRSDLLNFEGYIKRYNRVLVDYYSSSVNTATIEQVADNFWKDFNMERLVYLQGEILAHNWNTQIKNAEKQQSLDNLMRSLFNVVKIEKSKLTLDKLNLIAEQYDKNDVLQDINSLYSGKLLIPNKNSLGPCVYQSNMMLAPYSRGFDLDTSKETGKISSVKQDSRAFAAGLRDGQQFIMIEEQLDDISQTTNITIKDIGIIKVIKYYPYKGELKSIPQFILDQSMWETQKERCLAWFQAT